MRRLPSLTGIEAFIHVARTGSIKAAADELSLSSPAVSRRVQAIEGHVGRALFERRHQALVLTSEGESLFARIAPLIDSLSDVIEELSSQDRLLRLRLGVLPLYAAQRVIPFMSSLRARHTNLHLDIDTSSHAITRLGEGIDAAIVLARDIDPALYSIELDRDKILAVAALDVAKQITKPEDIRGHTVILHTEMPDTYMAWARAMGMANLEPAAVDYFDSGHLILEAAAQGLGVAFLHEGHFDGAHDKRLARLFDVPVASPYSYWFVCRPRALETKPVKIFHDWLVALRKARLA
jgi:LysR family transcriptional regulator, glycine cleavage system transcriptional activator